MIFNPEYNYISDYILYVSLLFTIIATINLIFFVKSVKYRKSILSDKANNETVLKATMNINFLLFVPYLNLVVFGIIALTYIVSLFEKILTKITFKFNINYEQLIKNMKEEA